MPQSWPSQWVILFMLFVFSFMLIMTLTFFLTMKSIDKNETTLYSSPQLFWSW